MLAEALNKNGEKATALENNAEIVDYLRNRADEKTIFITMGAGDIYKAGEQLLEI